MGICVFIVIINDNSDVVGRKEGRKHEIEFDILDILDKCAPITHFIN